MSEETDLLKSAVAHHGSMLVVLGQAYYDYKNACSEASWSFKKRIPIEVQYECVAKLDRMATQFFMKARETLFNDVHPPQDEVLPASVD